MNSSEDTPRSHELESWIDNKWRPTMGWVYMVTCVFDFILFPVLWALVLVYTKQPLVPWAPITLQSGGLYHIAMGAIVGITSFGRTKEKLAQTN